MIDLEYLNTLKKKSTIHFNLIPYITEKDGLLNATVISEKSNGLEGKDFYVCGPPAMNKAIREQLRAKGIKNNKIHSEEFSMS
jgi:ferredoxin-NADP reductase